MERSSRASRPASVNNREQYGRKMTGPSSLGSVRNLGKASAVAMRAGSTLNAFDVGIARYESVDCQRL